MPSAASSGVKGPDWRRCVGAFLIPDAAFLNIRHPLYSYFWLQHVGPGGLYGVAIAGTALILIVKGARQGRRVWIVSGVVVGALVAVFKVHIFAAAFPLLFSFAILAWPPRKRLRWLILGVCVVAGVALLPLANRFYIGPNIHYDLSGNAPVLEVFGKDGQRYTRRELLSGFQHWSSISFPPGASDRLNSA